MSSLLLLRSDREDAMTLTHAAFFCFSFLMTAIALRNLAVGLPPLEQLTREVAFANMKAPEVDGSQDERLKDEVGHGEL